FLDLTSFKFGRERWMLKITEVARTDQEVTLLLDGNVTGEWVALLRECAELVLELEMRLTLDLQNICFVDCEGLAVIKGLIRRGVGHMNTPLFVAEQIKKCGDAGGD